MASASTLSWPLRACAIVARADEDTASGVVDPSADGHVTGADTMARNAARLA